MPTQNRGSAVNPKNPDPHSIARLATTVDVPAVIPEALAIRVYGFVREQYPFGFKDKFAQVGHGDDRSLSSAT